jgi:hypothetical protein
MRSSPPTKLGDEEMRAFEPLGGIVKDLTIAASSESGRGRLRDLLVGKVTPKGETELTAEEVRATSRRWHAGARHPLRCTARAAVIDVKTFSRENGDDLSPA